MPPSKEFVGLVSEYVHTVAHGEAEGDEEAQKLARRTWGGLKRSAKAGTRRTVRAQHKWHADRDGCPCPFQTRFTGYSYRSLVLHGSGKSNKG